MFKVRCPALGHLSGRGRLEFQALQAEERPVIASRRICGGLPLQGLGKFGEQLEFDRLSGNAEHLHAAGLRSLTLPSACASSNPLTGKSCGCYVRNCPCCPWSGLCSRCELAPLVLEGTGSKLRRIRESYWCARWPSYGSSQPPILQAIATAVETTPFIGTLRRNPISIRHSGGISIPRLEAFKADTSCGSRFLARAIYQGRIQVPSWQGI